MNGSRRLHICDFGEHRLMAHMADWAEALGLPVRLLEDKRFLSSRSDFSSWAEGRKQLRMAVSIARCASVTGF